MHVKRDGPRKAVRRLRDDLIFFTHVPASKSSTSEARYAKDNRRRSARCGISSTEVKFSDDEMARFLNFDRLNRVQRVWNVSWKNE